MNDHLTTLARRALQPVAIHPRGQSRFEADAPAPRGLDSLVEEQVVAYSPGSSRVSQPPRENETSLPVLLSTPSHAVMPPPVPSEETRPGAAVVPAQAARLAPIIAEPISTLREPFTSVAEAYPVPPPERSPRVEQVENPRIERQVHERIEVHHERVERQTTLHSALEQRVERLTLIEPHAPLQAAVTASAPALQVAPVLAQPAEPRVEISIGRIEVLPLESPSVPRREEPARRPAAQTLDAYLEQRNGAGQGRGGRG